MKIDKPTNPNYCATVVAVKNITPLEGCDNVVATNFFGFQAIVGKETKIGDVGIVFPAETQLSDDFCSYNNLYRHSDKNADQKKKGYIEDNRRVKAVKFRGHPSNCLFLSLESLRYTKAPLEALNIGDEFDNLNGKEICKKYEVPRNPVRKNEEVEKRFVRVEAKHMPEHLDSSNYFKWGHLIPGDAKIIVTQKLHGTSVRIGHTIAKRKLNFIETVLSKVGVKIQPTTYDYIYGSRKVIKDINNPYQNHFYAEDIWTREGKKLAGILPENYIVYGELVGWATESTPIQANYTYSIPKGVCELYVYRIAIVNSQGLMTDLSWEHVKEFCTKNGLKYVPEIWTGLKRELNIESCMNLRFFEAGKRNCLYLGENKDLVDEGVCIRIDSINPVIYKAKSSKFLEHETKLLDKGEVDLESSQN